MRRSIVALVAVAALPFTTLAAQGRVKSEVRDVRQARRALAEDVSDRREAVRDRDKQEVRSETREIRHDKRVLEREQRDVRQLLRRRG
jgi:hypothetical protein